MKTDKNNFDFTQSIDFIERITDKVSKVFNSFDIKKPVFKTEMPSINLMQTENGINIEMALPGYDKKNISISLDKHLLTISGKNEENKEMYTFTRREFHYHTFSRSFNLSDSLDKDNIKSSMNNGILTIEIPKLSPEVVKAQKKTIPVQ
jgi:HSP20 family protein